MKDKDIAGLVTKAGAGDMDAFGQLYRIFARKILYHAREFIINKEDAEDAAQESVIVMFTHIGDLKSPHAFTTWMYRIIARVCYKRNVKYAQTRNQLNIDDYGDKLQDSDKTHRPEDATTLNHRDAKLMEIINGLSESQRRAIILYYYGGMKYKDIAEMLGVTMSTVSTNIIRAKKMIKKALEIDEKKDQNPEFAQKGSALAPAITQAISANAVSIFPAARVNSFCKACDIGLQTAATNAQAALASKGAVTLGVSGKVIAVAASVVVVASTIIAPVALRDSADTQFLADVSGSDTAAAEPYSPGAEIVLSGESGNVNPSEARLAVDDENAHILNWSILRADGGELYRGEGDTIGEELANLPPGSYQIRWVVKNRDGNTATVIRDFATT
jgi:RNA polymerase sigma-70 factor (ECF subfamily)